MLRKFVWVGLWFSGVTQRLMCKQRKKPNVPSMVCGLVNLRCRGFGIGRKVRSNTLGISGIWQWVILGLFFVAVFVVIKWIVRKKPQGSGTNTYINSASLAKWVLGLFYAQIIISIIAVISGLFEYQLLKDVQHGIFQLQTEVIAAAELNDKRQALIGTVQAIIYIGAAITFLKWVYRSNWNARALGASGMRFTPGWSIGWYFIPIALIWKPYQAMKEIWKASSNPDHWEGILTPSSLR